MVLFVGVGMGDVVWGFEEPVAVDVGGGDGVAEVEVAEFDGAFVVVKDVVGFDVPHDVFVLFLVEEAFVVFHGLVAQEDDFFVGGKIHEANANVFADVFVVEFYF